jgi:hypothetical protein
VTHKDGTEHPLTSPIVTRFSDYLGRTLEVQVHFNETNHNLTGVTTIRDPDCLYRRLYWGLGDDGTPDSSTRMLVVQFGTQNIPRGALQSLGLNTIEDTLNYQFTVGP